MTTITIDEETKEELLKVAAQLQIQRKEKNPKLWKRLKRR